MSEIYVLAIDDVENVTAEKVPMEVVKKMVECFCMGTELAEELDRMFDADLARMAVDMLASSSEEWLKIVKESPQV